MRLRAVTSEFRQQVRKVSAVEKQFKASAAEVEEACLDVAKHCSKFQQLKEKQRRQILTICDDREFLRPQLMQSKIDKFNMELFADGSGHSTLLTVSQGWDAIEESTMRQMKNESMENLSKAKWFLAYVNELQDYVRRTKFHVPVGCLRFLTTIKQLLMRGCVFNPDLFYHILEKTISDKHEHKNIVVHKSIKAVRDFIQISAEQFLSYLESKSIEPCVELVKQADTDSTQRKRQTQTRVSGVSEVFSGMRKSGIQIITDNLDEGTIVDDSGLSHYDQEADVAADLTNECVVESLPAYADLEVQSSRETEVGGHGKATSDAVYDAPTAPKQPRSSRPAFSRTCSHLAAEATSAPRSADAGVNNVAVTDETA